jgi:CDP-alcohol phosphatidyltransferase
MSALPVGFFRRECVLSSKSFSSCLRPGTFHPVVRLNTLNSRCHLAIPRATTLLSIFRQFSSPAPKKERHENLYTIPNILTFSRLLATPGIAYLILADRPYLATGLLFYAGLTDLVDGWIARKYDLKSVVGTVIDPMADKFLMITLTGALAYTGAMPSTVSETKLM